LRTDREALLQNGQSDATQRALVVDIERLENERRSLELAVHQAETKLGSLSNDLSDTEEQLARRQKTIFELEQQRNAQEILLTEAKRELEKINEEKLEERYAWLEAHLNIVLMQTDHELLRELKGFSGKRLVQFDGLPVESLPTIQEFYPPSRAQIWARIVKITREWRLETLEYNIPQVEKEYAHNLATDFISNCTPVHSPETFSFQLPYPELVNFQTQYQIYQDAPSFVNEVEAKLIEKKMDNAVTFANNQKKKALEFAKKFNRARLDYIVTVLDEVYMCGQSPRIIGWNSEDLDSLVNAYVAALDFEFERDQDYFPIPFDLKR